MRKNISLILFFLICFSCTEKTSIDSLAKAETLSERFESLGLAKGKEITVPIKISLTQNTIQRYDVDDILDEVSSAIALGGGSDEEKEVVPGISADVAVPISEKGFFGQLKEDILFKVANLGLSFGVQSRWKISINYDEFPEIDPEIINSARVNKLCLAVEPCLITDRECEVARRTKPSTILLLDKFFLNVSALQKPEDLDFLDHDAMMSIGKKDFKTSMKKAWGPQLRSFDNVTLKPGQNEDDIFYDLNIAKLDNDVNRDKYSKLKKKGEIRDNGKTFIARIDNQQLVKTKKFFSREAFKKSVRDITFLGNSMVVELHTKRSRGLFFKTIQDQEEDLRSVGVYDIEGCTVLTCTEVKVNPINLVPLLQKSTNIKFDTFISVNKLDENDFRYGGFIELEVKLELPL